MSTVEHPIFARLYPRVSRAMGRRGLTPRRRQLLAELSGKVLEVGAGSGDNFEHYPATVEQVVAVEPEPYLRRLAEQAAARAPVPISVVGATVDALPVADACMDAVVVSLVLCSVPDQASALGEIHRVLRPGGELRFLEHVRADTPGMARFQRLLDAVQPRFAGGCHTGRDTGSAIAAAGFRIDRLEDFRFPEATTPVSRHLQGRAVRL